MTIDLAVIMNRPPHEMDVMTYRDSLDFMTRHGARKKVERKFEAALHGRELK